MKNFNLFRNFGNYKLVGITVFHLRGISTTIDLFLPIQLGDDTLPNWIVMAPMTRNRAGDGNAPVAINAEYYAAIAEVSTGPILFSRNPDGVVIEWLQWRYDIWGQVKATSSATLS